MTPIDKRLYKYVEGKPFLRTTLLVIAAIGISKGAVDVALPILTKVGTPLLKLLPIKPEDADAKKYECAFSIHRRVAAAQDALSYSPKSGEEMKLHLEHVVREQQEIDACYELFGFSNRVAYAYSSGASAEDPRIRAETREKLMSSYSAFRGRLDSISLPASRFLELGKDLNRLERDLRACWKDNCPNGLPHAVLQQAANVEHSRDQAAKAYPYRFPALRLDTASAKSLRFSAGCFKREVWAAIGLSRPKVVPQPPDESVETSGETITLVIVPCPV